VSRAVVVRVEIDDTRLVAEVRDEGEAFDLQACTEDSTLPANIEREDGRGLFLMQKLMDTVERYTAEPPGGNVVRMVLIRG
jgi:anti-sigma regulatory factor (Ser/Thr protein kinase)